MSRGLTVALAALGSNLGDRLRNLEEAATRISARCAAPGTLVSSHAYETPPWGGVPQPDYLNAVVRFETELDPHPLLDRMLEIEASMGRVRAERYGPRVIDLDLLDCGGAVLAEPGLVLPHPRIPERAFVLVPLCEILPGWRHPLTGETAVEMLIALNPDPGEARLFGPLRVRSDREDGGADSSAG